MGVKMDKCNICGAWKSVCPGVIYATVCMGHGAWHQVVVDEAGMSAIQAHFLPLLSGVPIYSSGGVASVVLATHTTDCRCGNKIGQSDGAPKKTRRKHCSRRCAVRAAKDAYLDRHFKKMMQEQGERK